MCGLGVMSVLCRGFLEVRLVGSLVVRLPVELGGHGDGEVFAEVAEAARPGCAEGGAYKGRHAWQNGTNCVCPFQQYSLLE